MRATYTSNPSFAPLAWLARVDQGEQVSVEHGKFVEVNPGFFFEGAWAGAFALGRPDATEVAFGSGAIVFDDSILFEGKPRGY